MKSFKSWWHPYKCVAVNNIKKKCHWNNESKMWNVIHKFSDKWQYKLNLSNELDKCKFKCSNQVKEVEYRSFFCYKILRNKNIHYNVYN